MTDKEDFRRIALSLPETNQDQNGSSFSVNSKGFAWFYRERVHPKKPRVLRFDALAVRVANEEEKQFLLVTDPEKYFTTDHYNGYPAVLVRLPKIDIEELEELLTDAWRTRAPRV